jgi:hypothetical protein
MSVHNSAKFQHCGVIFAKSAVDTKKPLIFPLPRAFFADIVEQKLAQKYCFNSFYRQLNFLSGAEL